MKGRKPRYIRVYDNGGDTVDRYTVVFTGRYRHKTFRYISMNGAPYHPQGFYQHGESHAPVDKPTHEHLGRRIKFEDLPRDCQDAVWDDYKNLWKRANI